ncbi:ABC transporter ATP-binding protein [Spiroplasma turonicum]|uniref:Unspecified ABC transporter ATP-binding subunit n=1 Tax=Spiroplasma turonicum TaxID=216946 RepID=A0A0K1P765_9MOLU|nr:ABC transporter ATP-binding protein [Spiroplasma turonicum]AKU80039.1 unspecified ABC transporter ATP-binding subunit [Spiroplasma turonicum]ALX71041.1 ABC transporter ATP-binding protein [Spiroplasma turonicum]
MKLVEIKNLTKSFKNKTILQNISLTINQGESVAILGKNGAGKTTLVEMIAKITKPTKGEIIINIGKNLKQEIGIQFQEGNWPSGLCAKDIIEFYTSVFPNFSIKKFEELDKTFEIKTFYKTPLNRLSGGQKQRFNALLSIINNPKLIVLDELTTGLDMELQFKILNFFKEVVSKKQTLIIVSHHPEEVEKLCNRIIIIDNKKVLMDKSIEEVKEQFKNVRNLMEMFYRGELSEK